MCKFKRLASALLTLVMTLAFSITAFATGTGYTVTIDDGDVSEARYAAYKLMDVTTGTTTDGETTYAYTVNSKYSSILQILTSTSSDNDVIAYITDLTDAAEIRQFADDIYEALTNAGLEADETTSTNEFTDISGYYLFVETTTGTGTDESYSLAMLQTIYENTTIKTKEGVPTLEKKVQEINDSEYSNEDGAWQDAADYDIGDDVPFSLIATVPSYYVNYEEYKLVFHDEMSDGLTFNSASVKVYVSDGNTDVLLDGTDYTITENPLADDCAFEITITDLNNLSTAISFDTITEVKITYIAELNDDAVIGTDLNGDGNPNMAYLEFSNNPYDDSSTGTTPEDKVTVFTFNLEVNKVDDDGEDLAGAGFTLYKWYATGDRENDGTWEAVGNEQVNASGSDFSWEGLDSGKYKIEETTIPNGYSKADIVYFTITSNYDTESDDPKLTSLSLTITEGANSAVDNTANKTLSSGTVAMGVINKSGISLPSTGGIGTTIFYVVGGVLIIGALVILITRKRMDKEAEEKTE